MIDPHVYYRLHAAALAQAAPAARVPVSQASAHDPLVILVSGSDTAVIAAAPGSVAETGSGSDVFDNESAASFPTLGSISRGSAADVISQSGPSHEIAVWQGRPVYALGVDSDQLDAIAEACELTRENYRGLYLRISDVELGLLGRAIQIVDWYATSRYCSACGKPTVIPEHESVARCPQCGHDQYPRLAPAMIVAVVRDGTILLARAPRFRGAFHSVLAGFVEPGESVEECVHREVFEETRVLVKNVRYFGSQSWPFPHSLMLGFTADWAGGEIEIDGEELEHADWYAAHELPAVPSEISISGRLIRHFRETFG